MKILFLSNTIDPTSGGYGRYTYDLQRALKHAGEEATSLPEFLGAELSDPFAYLTKPFLFLRDYRSIRRAILQHQPNIVHITFEPYALLVPLLPLGKAKVFLTVHGTYAYAPSFAPFGLHWLYRILFARALARLSGIVAVSDYTKQHLLRQAMRDAVKLSADFITTVHNGISMSTYALPAASAHEDGRKHILTVAPAKSRKGLLESIRAMGVYKEQYGGIFFYHIVGSYEPDSQYYHSLEAEIQKYGLGEQVSFLGRISDEALREEYAQADLFLMLPIVKPGSTPAFEGFGLVYLEANACGVPVIGSQKGGSAEAIKDGVSGFVVDAHDPNAVASKIHAVLDENAIARPAARAWAEEHDIAIVAGQIQNFYR